MAASYAPSWKNTQTTRYIAITNEEVKARLATECCAEHNAQIINGAPLLIATLIVDKRSGFERDGSFSTSRKDAWQAFDNGIATQTLCLAANDIKKPKRKIVLLLNTTNCDNIYKLFCGLRL